MTFNDCNFTEADLDQLLIRMCLDYWHEHEGNGEDDKAIEKWFDGLPEDKQEEYADKLANGKKIFFADPDGDWFEIIPSYDEDDESW